VFNLILSIDKIITMKAKKIPISELPTILYPANIVEYIAAAERSPTSELRFVSIR
jgi:hypothetical protein